jgi:hypothetical protein
MTVFEEGDQLGIAGNRPGELVPSARAEPRPRQSGRVAALTETGALPGTRVLPIDRAIGIASTIDSAAAANGSPGPCYRRHPTMASRDAVPNRAGKSQLWPIANAPQRCPSRM